MNFSDFFIRRPVGTILISIGILLVGIVAYRLLPVASLPSVDIPTIRVSASRPGADPATMAASVAAPLERRLGEIAGVTEITSVSSPRSAQLRIARGGVRLAHPRQGDASGAGRGQPAVGDVHRGNLTAHGRGEPTPILPKTPAGGWRWASRAASSLYTCAARFRQSERCQAAGGQGGCKASSAPFPSPSPALG